MLDGVDPGSANPLDRVKYLVYQRRMYLNALRDKATLLALCGNTEAAATVSTTYIETVIPIPRESAEDRDASLQRELDAITALGPLTGKAIVA